MIRKAAVVIVAFFALLMHDEAAQAQRHEQLAFVQRNDTAFVRGAGVVLLGLSDSAIKHVWESARTAADSENANTALDDYGWYLGTSRQLLDSLHIPSYTTGCRYISILEDTKVITFDRTTFRDSDGIEQFDAVVYDGRSVYQFLPEFQLGNPEALATIKKILHVEG